MLVCLSNSLMNWWSVHKNVEETSIVITYRFFKGKQKKIAKGIPNTIVVDILKDISEAVPKAIVVALPTRINQKSFQWIWPKFSQNNCRSSNKILRNCEINIQINSWHYSQREIGEEIQKEFFGNSDEIYYDKIIMIRSNWQL